MTPLRPSVLVVDDAPANLVALRELLAPLDVEVLEASNGNQALSLLLDREVALILLDVDMPVMDGYAVAALVKGVGATRDIPIIFLTAAYKDLAHRIQGYRSGGVDYIEKPIDEEILLSKMQVFLDLYRSRKQLQELNEELEQRVAERTAELQRTNRELHASLERQRETERRLETLISNLPGAVYRSRPDQQRPMEFLSDGCLAITGYPAEALLAGAEPGYHTLIHPEDRPMVAERIRQALDQHLPFQIEYRLQTRDGRPCWVWEQGRGVRDGQGRLQALEGFISDISRIKEIQGRLIDYQQVLQKQVSERTRALEREVLQHQVAQDQLRMWLQLFEHARWGGLVASDEDVEPLSVNPAFCRMHDYPVDGFTGLSLREIMLTVSHSHVEDRLQTVREKGHHAWEGLHVRRDGDSFPVSAEMTAVREPGSEQSFLVLIVQDITERKHVEEQLKENQNQLHRLAYFDSLTRLPNRRLLADRLEQAIASARRRDRLLAVCYLDLDGFKEVNDSLGHGAGDQVLVNVSSRLLAAVRAEDSVARLGGDEFVIILGALRSFHECSDTLERILLTLANPHMLQGRPFSVTGSIGVTLYPEDASDPDTLLRHADQAMYLAKQSGRSRFHYFDLEKDRLATAQQETLLEIQQAVRAGDLCLRYQPRVDMRQGRVLGVEALLRWRHPQRGLLLPDSFLPAVKGSELMRDIDHWVLRRTLERLNRWCCRGWRLQLNVNISARTLHYNDFVDFLRQLLARYPRVSPQLLQLELIESEALEDFERVSRAIGQVEALGIGFVLDNFGTSYSSLTYFRRLPVRMLKIDQSFVCGMLQDHEDLSIVAGIIGLSCAFGRQVAACGVESGAHGEMLLRLGCDLAQGIAIAPPMASFQLPDWLQGNQYKNWSGSTEQRWLPEDLPLLAVEAEHRAWVDRLIKALRHGTAGDLSVEDSGHCRFQGWYKGVGQKKYGHLALFRELGALHQEIHRIGAELLTISDWQPEAAIERLPELIETREKLVVVLRRLQQRLGSDGERGGEPAVAE